MPEKCLHLRYINCQHAVTLSTPCVSMYQYMCVHVHQGHSTHDWIHIKAVCVTCNVIRHHSNSSKPRLERKWKWGKKTLKQLQLFRNHKPTVNPTIVSLQLERSYKLTFTCSMIWQKKWLTQYVWLLHHYHRWSLLIFWFRRFTMHTQLNHFYLFSITYHNTDRIQSIHRQSHRQGVPDRYRGLIYTWKSRTLLSMCIYNVCKYM